MLVFTRNIKKAFSSYLRKFIKLLMINNVVIFFSRRDVRIFLVFTATGAVAQFAATKYLEKRPDLIRKKGEPLKPRATPDPFAPKPPTPPVPITKIDDVPGIKGGFIELSVPTLEAIGIALLNHIAESGMLFSMGLWAASQLPVNAIALYINNATPQNLSFLEKKKFILKGQPVQLDQCHTSFEYAFATLKSREIPFDQKKKLVKDVFKHTIEFTSAEGKILTILCLISLLFSLFHTNESGFFILMDSLKEEIISGKISKSVGRLIVRRLQARGIPIDPSLIAFLENAKEKVKPVIDVISTVDKDGATIKSLVTSN
jgi:hypothetical protein